MIPKKTKVVLIERYLVFYRQEIYRRLADLYDMTFLYSGEQLGDLPELTGVRKQAVRCMASKIRARRKIVWMSVLRALVAIRPNVVIIEISTSLLSTWLLFLLRPILKFRLLFWGHGLEDYWKTKPNLTYGDRLRLLWFKWSDGVIVYGHRGLAELRTFLPSHPNLVRSPNAQNSDEQEVQFLKLEISGRAAARIALGIESFAFVYIGRLADGKGLERIPEMARFLHSKGTPFEMHFIGDGPARDNLQKELADIGVKAAFHGTISDEPSKGKILYACDCLLGPGPLGLAIVDALGYGCPVLALDDSNFHQKHGPEIEYLKPGISGLLARTPRDWLNAALDLVASNQAAHELRGGSLATFRSECQIQSQLDGVCQAVEQCLTGRAG
jgi:glycosyltransferase involved in cell wall biosynthesis